MIQTPFCSINFFGFIDYFVLIILYIRPLYVMLFSGCYKYLCLGPFFSHLYIKDSLNSSNIFGVTYVDN